MTPRPRGGWEEKAIELGYERARTATPACGRGAVKQRLLMTTMFSS